MQETFQIVFNISMLFFVSGSMITLGLGLTMAQIFEPFKNITKVILVLIANFVLVPLLAFSIVQWLPVPEGVKIGLILLSLGGGAPFIPMVVAVAKGNIGSSVGIMVLLLVVTIFFMPIAVPIMLPGVSVSSWDIAKLLVSMMLIPLVLALFIKARFSAFAERIVPFVAKLTSLATLILVVSVLYLYTETIIASVSVLPVILLFFSGAAFIGYLTGGRDRHDRISFTVGTSLRNPPVAILVASQSFPSEPMAAIVPLLVAIVGLIILFPLAKISEKRHRSINPNESIQ